MILADDVQTSAAWYRGLLDCKSDRAELLLRGNGFDGPAEPYRQTLLKADTFAVRLLVSRKPGRANLRG